jgi:hypothetical protein
LSLLFSALIVRKSICDCNKAERVGAAGGQSTEQVKQVGTADRPYQDAARHGDNARA